MCSVEGQKGADEHDRMHLLSTSARLTMLLLVEFYQCPGNVKHDSLSDKGLLFLFE